MKVSMHVAQIPDFGRYGSRDFIPTNAEFPFHLFEHPKFRWHGASDFVSIEAEVPTQRRQCP